MADHTINMPWVSFCISTYKRPLLLKQQLESILRQTFLNFEIVISDNDPDRSAEAVVNLIADPRLKYFPNTENLGMMKSFNKSIERSVAEFVITITDDDPVVQDMLEVFFNLINNYPGYGIYVGCSRVGKKEGEIEIFDNKNFLFQILSPALTDNLLWSSCIIKKNVLLDIGGIPDYGSPHLADHAMIALCGTINGGVLINKMYSELTAHDNNFSKGNIHLYYISCIQFYDLITKNAKQELYIINGENALIQHLDRWFLVAMFSLKKYFTYYRKEAVTISQIALESKKILHLSFMKHLRVRFYLKLLIFNLKKILYVFTILVKK